MQIFITIVITAISILLTWLIADRYYKRSLKQQEQAASEQISILLNLQDTDIQLKTQKRIEECIQEYNRAGTPVRVIDSYSDMSMDEKANLLDTVLLRVKGRRAKTNKYRSNN